MQIIRVFFRSFLLAATLSLTPSFAQSAENAGTPVNLLNNADFSAGSKNWSLVGGSLNDQQVASLLTREFKENCFTLKYKGDEKQANTWIMQKITLKPLTSYVLSASLKFPGGMIFTKEKHAFPVIGLHYYNSKENKYLDFRAVKLSALKDEWNAVRFQDTPPAGADSVWIRIGLDAQNLACEASFKNITFTEIEE